MVGSHPAVYGAFFSDIYNRDWSFWGDHVWPLVSRVVRERNPAAHTWLDLACGTGSLLQLVIEAGYQATGVDLSPHQLAHARANVPEAELLEADIRAVDLGRRFDVITCMFDSLNYLTEPGGVERAVRRAVDHLAEGGLFIFDVNTFEGLEERWKRTSAVRDDNHVIIVENSFSVEAAVRRILITGFIREGELYRKFEEEHFERACPAKEMQAILTRHGLRFEAHDGNSLQEPEAGAMRLLYVCQRA